MAKFLYIDTSGETAIVALSNNETILAIEQNNQANSHAAFLQIAVKKLMDKACIPFVDLDAIVVTMGPGSYTGLRVGLSSAKGIAYALNKPLIGLSTLALLKEHANNHEQVVQNKNKVQIFSMIDAKRMEVFGAVYKADNSVVIAPKAIVLEASYLQKLLQNGPVICCGNAITKTKEILKHPNLYFIETPYNIDNMVHLAQTKWATKDFEDIAYSSPAYLKEFYQIPSKKS